MFLESQIDHPMRKGSIEVICGSMFSGKTEELLRRLKRAKYAKLNIKIFKPKIDTRYDEEKVIGLIINPSEEKVVIQSNRYDELTHGQKSYLDIYS